MPTVFKDQDNDFENKRLTKLVSISVNRDPSSDNELTKKEYVDDSIGEGSILRFDQTLQNYLKISIVDAMYDLTKYDKQDFRHTTVTENPNRGRYLLQHWNIECNDKNKIGKKPEL